jgi:hypothetical protein
MAYHGFFPPHLDDKTISDLRLALNQPLGNERFPAKI